MPASTLVNSGAVPLVEAALLVAANQGEKAVAALEPTRPVQWSSEFPLIPSYLRGRGLLEAGKFAEAAAEFESVQAKRWIDPFTPVVPLSRLGLARARAAAGDVTGARQVYEELLLKTWKEADADVPVVSRAKQEYRKLTAGS